VGTVGGQRWAPALLVRRRELFLELAARRDPDRVDRVFEAARVVERVRLFRAGTFAPARRAWERPIATACLRLVTRLRERPLFNVPRFRSCIARSTFCDAFFPYLAIASPRQIHCTAGQASRS